VVGYSEDSSELAIRLGRQALELGADRFFHRDQLFGSVSEAASKLREVASLLIGTSEYSTNLRSQKPVEKDALGEPGRRTVGVIYGRNTVARQNLFTFLRALDLSPVEWEEAVSWTGQGTPNISEILDTIFARVQAVIVLLTPDEEVRLVAALRSSSEKSSEAGFQARPNVYFEAGMAIARAPDRTILVQLGDVRPISDLRGRFVVRLDNSPERRETLAGLLERAGCEVRKFADYFTAGDFEVVLNSRK
jgi:predicted nucleotide-binding protein